MKRIFVLNLVAAGALFTSGVALAQQPDVNSEEFTSRGFIETDNEYYPQTVPIDTSHGISEELLRWEFTWKPFESLQINGGFDGRFDSHQEVERAWHLDWSDRTLQRPPMSIRDLNLVYNKGHFTATIGKQFIRWGKADILNPTDRFAPRDFLELTDADFLGVTAVRAVYDTGADSFDFVFQPWFTPSRTPLLNQRWTFLPPQTWSDLIADYGAVYPGRPAYGVRWNHTGSAAEYSFNYYQGSDNLPLFNVLSPPPGYDFAIQRFYPELRELGADLAMPLSWATVKAEVADFSSTNKLADEYILYVLELQRQVREWNFTGGYAGEVVYNSPSPFYYSPERGFARSFVGHAGWTIDTTKELSLQGIARQNGRGELLEATYSQTFGQHWRATVGYVVVGGDEGDFIGEYNHNSHAIAALRYSF